MKKLQLLTMLALGTCIQTHQTFAMANVEAAQVKMQMVETQPLIAAPAAQVAAPAVAQVVVPTAQVAPVTESVATPAPQVVVPTAQPAAPASSMNFDRMRTLAYATLLRTAHDVHSVVKIAVTAVKDMSEDLYRSVRHFIHEKTADDKVVVQSRNETTTGTSWIPVVAYESNVPVIAYEEITNSSTGRRS